MFIDEEPVQIGTPYMFIDEEPLVQTGTPYLFIDEPISRNFNEPPPPYYSGYTEDTIILPNYSVLYIDPPTYPLNKDEIIEEIIDEPYNAPRLHNYYEATNSNNTEEIFGTEEANYRFTFRNGRINCYSVRMQMDFERFIGHDHGRNIEIDLDDEREPNRDNCFCCNLIDELSEDLFQEIQDELAEFDFSLGEDRECNSEYYRGHLSEELLERIDEEIGYFEPE